MADRKLGPHHAAAVAALNGGDPDAATLWDRVREAIASSADLDVERPYDVFRVGRYVGEMLAAGEYKAGGPGGDHHNEYVRPFLEKPWECPRCHEANLMVRAVALPGGAPGGPVRREATVTYEAKCGACSVEMFVTFKPAGAAAVRVAALEDDALASMN